MKRIACLLSFSLLLLGVFQGLAGAQQLSEPTGQVDGNSDPLDKVKNKVKEEVDKAKGVVDETVPGAEEPVDDVTNEVEDSADNVVEDSGDVAEDAGDTAGSITDEPTRAGTTQSDTGAPGSTNSKTKLTKSTKRSGKGSKDASGAESSDTHKVAAVGNTIESTPKNDGQLAAPEADADESEGSILSSTGVQILAWLVLAWLLIAAGFALVRRRSRA